MIVICIIIYVINQILWNFLFYQDPMKMIDKTHHLVYWSNGQNVLIEIKATFKRLDALWVFCQITAVVHKRSFHSKTMGDAVWKYFNEELISKSKFI